METFMHILAVCLYIINTAMFIGSGAFYTLVNRGMPITLPRSGYNTITIKTK